MKVFVHEYVCGGGWLKGDQQQSLATEGGGMLRAICEDLARLPEVEVTTTLNVGSTLELPESVTVVAVDSPEAGLRELVHHATSADAAFVIAPEIENVLARRIRELREAGANVIAPVDGWIENLSNKLFISGWLAFHGIPTIPTFPLEQDEPHRLTSDRAVIKPSFGAGSQTLSVLPSVDVEKLRTPRKSTPLEQLIVQPFVPGVAVSMATIINSLGERVILPVARQLLSNDDYLQYEGGIVPWVTPAEAKMQQIVRHCYEIMEGLEGYVGFDFVIPDAEPNEPLLVEINPRLCTSYLGYRELTDDNLVARMLPNWPKSDICWKDQVVRFEADGTSALELAAGSQPCG